EEDRHQEASARPVVDPGHHHREANGEDREDGDAAEGEAAVERGPVGPKVIRQVPRGPDDTYDRSPHQWSPALLQPGQRKAAPAGLLRERSPRDAEEEIQHRKERQVAQGQGLVGGKSAGQGTSAMLTMYISGS